MNFKGIKLYYYIAEFVLIVQILKLANFLHSISMLIIVSIILTIGLSIKLVVFDKKLSDTKCWLFIAYMIILEAILGLDGILKEPYYYNAAILSALTAGVGLQFMLDAPSIRKQMDEDTYVLKGTCSLLMLAIVAAVIEIVLDYM